MLTLVPDAIEAYAEAHSEKPSPLLESLAKETRETMEDHQMLVGPALETIKSLTGPFEFVFIDADKENMIAYFERVLALVPSGGLIAVDNTLWSGRVLEPRAQSDRAVVAFNEHLARDARVQKLLLTLRDGVTLAWKR